MIPPSLSISEQKEQQKKETTCLIIGGDTAEIRWNGWTSFLQFCIQHYHYTLFILGNHEYYYADKIPALLNQNSDDESNRNDNDNKHVTNDQMKQAEDYLKQLLAQVNATHQSHQLHLLQKNTMVIENITFVGCTLWSKIKAHDADATQVLFT